MAIRTEERARTRQDLIDAFWSLYRSGRASRISVRAVAEKAGYNRSTFYEYFPDVPAVLEAIESALVPSPGELPPVDAVPPGAPDGAFPVEAFLKLYQSHKDYYEVLLGDRGDPAFLGRMKDALRPSVAAKLRDAGFRNEEELGYRVEFILSAMLGTLTHWIRQPKPLPPERVVAMLQDFFRDGFRAEAVMRPPALPPASRGSR